MLETDLQKLGLGDHEALVYSVLLRNSPASATLLAKKCALSRSSVYTTLASLTAKGLVGTTYKNEVKQFIADGVPSLTRMLGDEERTLHERQKLLGTLEQAIVSLGQRTSNRPEVIFYEGIEGVRKIYWALLQEAPVGSLQCIVRNAPIGQPPWDFVIGKQYQERKQEKRIVTRILFNNSRESRAEVKSLQGLYELHMRFLAGPERLEQFVQTVMGDTVALCSFENNNFVGIKITNKHIAENFYALYDTLWTTALKK